MAGGKFESNDVILGMLESDDVIGTAPLLLTRPGGGGGAAPSSV